MSIFDSIIGDITPLATALNSSFTGAGNSNTNGMKDVDLYRQERYANLLNFGVQRQSPDAAPGQYRVTKSQADVTVDPEELKQQWLRRLDAYSTVVAKSGVKGK